MIGSEGQDPFSEERLATFRDKLASGGAELGLYFEGARIRPMELGDQIVYGLDAFFKIGDVAWSKRVQDPATDQVDTQIAVLEETNLHDEIEAIKKRYQRGEG